MIARTVYRLYKLTERDGYVECSHTTSATLAACILRACERQAQGAALYEVRPALPAHTLHAAPASADAKRNPDPAEVLAGV